MLRTVPMQKIRIVALAGNKYEIIRELQQMGVIEIKRSSLGLEDDEVLNQITEVSELLVKFRSALSFLKAPKHKGKIKPAQQLEQAELLKRCRVVKEVEEINSLVEKKRTLTEHVKGLESGLASAALFEDMNVDFGKLGSKGLAFRAFIADPTSTSKLKHLISEKRIRNEIVESRKDNKLVLFLAFDASQRNALDEIVQPLSMEEIDITEGNLNAKPKDVILKLEKEKHTELEEIKKIEHRLAKIGEEHYIEIAALAEMLDSEYDRSQVSSNFKKTEHTFVVEGWVPKKNMDELYRRIKNATKQKCQMEEINDGELAPTLMNRPKLLSPFDYLVGFYSLPRSDEIDPTWFFILSFLVFYGMMVSDFGYGVMSLIFATVLVRKFPEEGLMNSVARVWQLASIPIMIFGILSNQFFGISLAAFKGIMFIDWINNVPGLLTLTIFMGITQIIIGLAFGFINKYRHHETKLAISKLTSIVVMLAGTLAVGGGLFGFMSSYTMPAVVITVVAALITIALSGIEAVEFTNLITHTLSYTRIFGFGLASVIIASLVDKAFTPSLSGGIIGFVVFGALFLLLHTMNMLLSIFEGVVQAARLNFIEFFSKFYTGGGEKFEPYHFTRRYTKE